MRHQSILMWIKVHCYQNTFTGLEFSNIKIFNQKIHFFKISGKVKILKSSVRFELI